MHSYSYKYFLHIEKKLPKLSPAAKLMLLTLAIILVLFGVVSSLAYYRAQKVTPTKTARVYLQTAIIGLASTRSAVAELVNSAAVAGAKTKYIEIQEDPQAKPAYDASLADVEKIISQINLIRKNLESHKTSLETGNTPPQYQDITLALINYYQDLDAVLLNLIQDFRFTREITLALGPNLYLPVLSQKNLWEKGNSAQIKSHYQNLREGANTALAKLARLETPEKFRPYLEQEIAYITLLVNLSTAIVNTLSISGDTSGDSATQIEKAYELLVLSARENAQLAQDIFQKRNQIFDTKNTLEELASIRLQENSLVVKLEDAINQYSSQF